MLKKILIFIVLSLFLTACVEKSIVHEENSIDDIIAIENDSIKQTKFENLDIPENYDIRQFEGMTLNFIVENNLYANILSRENGKFFEATGINIKIRPMDFDTLMQKINLDFIAKDGEYQIVYVDPYQTLNRFHNYLEVLNPYNEDSKTPNIKGFTDDFFENQTYVSSYFKENENLYTVPFDSTTMILYYRKDIFDKYKDKFFEEMGYDWTPGTKEFTWERYIEVSKWIDENVPNEEVKYGSGQMAQKHNSIYCDFSNVLAAYGGDYFLDENINTLGLDGFNEVNVLDENFIEALDIYKEMVKVAAPNSINWNWTDTASAFRNGEIAMMANWDENYSYIEQEDQSKVYSKTGYSILPYGDERSANIYGGSGIGINKYASEAEKQAAWLYIVWATSKEMQLKVLNHLEGGSLPTRKSVYEDKRIQFQIENSDWIEDNNNSIKHLTTVLEAWEKENLYLRPQISNSYEVESVIISNLYEMIKYDFDSTEVSEKIYSELNEVKE